MTGGLGRACPQPALAVDAVNEYAELTDLEVTIEAAGLERFLGQTFYYVITVCDRSRQACPVFPGSGNSLHWGLLAPLGP